MKTLTESIINELRLSKVSTGNKLKPRKTFGDLVKGDYIFETEYSYSAKGLEIYIYQVKSSETLKGFTLKYIVDETETNKKALDFNVYCVDIDNGREYQVKCVKDAHSVTLHEGKAYLHKFANIVDLLEFVNINNTKIIEQSRQELIKLGLIK